LKKNHFIRISNKISVKLTIYLDFIYHICNRLSLLQKANKFKLVELLEIQLSYIIVPISNIYCSIIEINF
jgi:hypothetical protein